MSRLLYEGEFIEAAIAARRAAEAARGLAFCMKASS